jgi:NAD(P)H-nitrite reductase large subunit
VFGYGKLLVATGVRARHLTVSGSDKKGIHYLRTLEDGKGIMAHIKTAKKCAVIGGGFIGFEMADLAKLAGLETVMILRESYFWEPTLDPVEGKMVEKALEKGGITLKKSAEIKEIIGGDSVEGIVLVDGTRIDCDMIIAGIGITTPIEWIKHDGGKTNTGILCNEYLETSLPDVYAAGDIAEYKDLLLEETVQMGSWVNAHEQGRVAGINMAGPEKIPFKFISFYTTQGLGISIAFVGDARALPDRKLVTRGSEELGWFTRFLIVGKELEGATLINKTGDLTTISKLIEKNVDVSGVLDKLADPTFNLKELLPK